TVSMENKVRQLAESVQVLGRPLHRVKLARDTPDYDLPEVRAEQEYHRTTFAGREAWLARLHHWVDQTVEGGYFLLVGPPGQGKSALLARLAETTQASSSAGCLLHLERSHKTPRRFLQFLLWQAERLLGQSLGETAYVGDVDDLRNTLLGVLEKLRQK